MYAGRIFTGLGARGRFFVVAGVGCGDWVVVGGEGDIFELVDAVSC